MGKGAVLSGLLHLAVVLLAVFGLPWLYDTNEVLQATPISVISEAQFAELKNQRPPAQQKKPDQPKDKEIPPAPKAPEVAQPEPEPEPPPEPELQQAAEPPPQPQPPPVAAPRVTDLAETVDMSRDEDDIASTGRHRPFVDRPRDPSTLVDDSAVDVRDRQSGEERRVPLAELGSIL
jgi:outer membrane biosynthesis protein TonB